MEQFHLENAHAPITLKITDFDTIKELHQTMSLSFKGTFAWMAPEVLTEQRFSQNSDVWRLVHFLTTLSPVYTVLVCDLLI